MHLRNLFTSNSKPSSMQAQPQPAPAQQTRPRAQRLLTTAAWFCCTLVAFDLAINRLFPYPTDPLNTDPGTLNLYFDYGRSLEAKVARQIGPTDETSAPIAQAGWLGNIPDPAEPTQPSPGHNLVSLYGMSFLGQVGAVVHELDPSLEMREHLGPAAPPNHSFAAYRIDRTHQQARVVVWGILASSIKGMDAISGMSLMTDVPAPFTFPHYGLQNGQLTETLPQIQSLAQLRATAQDPQKQAAWANQLSQQDRLIDRFIYEANWLDQSALMRMGRRAWTKSYQSRIESQIHDQNGFNPNWPQAAVLKAMVADFANTARADGKIPVVILFNDRGFADHLDQLLVPTLTIAQIPYVSTDPIAPASDPNNFVGDGHFTPAANRQISEQVTRVIQQQLQEAAVP
jgi:hypothetical protein